MFVKLKVTEINERNRDKEGHCIVIKGSFQQENKTIVNIYAQI